MTVFSGTAGYILGLPEVQAGIRTTFTLAERVFQSMCVRSFCPDDANKVYLNKYVLSHTVESYYCDLYRLTLFRGITADNHKQAAFLCKWIAKLRPVQIHADATNPSLSVLLSNEYFAVAVGLVTLFRSVTTPARVIVNEADYIQNLAYLLHYHSCISPEQLASELYQLERRYLSQY